MANDNYTIHGRTLMVKFTCSRCGDYVITPYADQAQETEGNLQCFKPPEGWFDPHCLYIDLLCPRCAAAFNNFMKGGNVT